MSERKRIFLLIAIMITVCLFVAGATILILYKTGLKEQRARLMETAQSQARLIEAVARFDAAHEMSDPGSYPEGAATATLSQIIDAHDHYKGFGKTGEFTLSKIEGDNIVFLLSHRHYDLNMPKPVPFESELAEPMRRALLGQSGTVVGIDYRGEKVLAAYEPVAELNLGIVAKIDMFEIRAPFVKAGFIGALCTVSFVLIGTILFVRVTNPMIRQLEKRALELEKLNDEMEVEINGREKAEAALRKSERELNIRNRISEIFLTIPDDDMYGEVLNVILEAMKSKYGTFAYIDEDGTRIVPSMTRGIWDECKMPEKDIVFPRGTWGDNIWARCLIEKEPIFSNGPFKVPNGHIPITRSLAVPIIHQGEVVGNFMVGNKPTDYDEKDRKLLEVIADSIAPILEARLHRDSIERKRRQAEEALRNAHDKLESRIEERTVELVKANEQLKVEIEERRRAENAFRKGEEKYRFLIKTLPSIVYKGYKDWYVELFDEKIELLTGYGADEFNSRKMKWYDVILEEDISIVKENFVRALKTDKIYVREYRIKSYSGEIKWIQDRGYIVCNNRGEVEFISGVFFDITDRKTRRRNSGKPKNCSKRSLTESRTPLSCWTSILR